MKDEREIRLEVLLHESQQVHDTLSRTLSVANALFGAVLPVAVGFLLYTAGKEDTALPLDVLAAGLAAVVSLTAIFNAGLWVEISRYIHYKYVKLYPELYKLAGLDGENFGQYLARQQQRYPSLATAIFHVVIFSFSIVLVVGGLRKGTGPEQQLVLIVLCVLFVVSIVLTYVWAIPEIVRNLRGLVKAGEEACAGATRGVN